MNNSKDAATILTLKYSGDLSERKVKLCTNLYIIPKVFISVPKEKILMSLSMSPITLRMTALSMGGHI